MTLMLRCIILDADYQPVCEVPVVVQEENGHFPVKNILDRIEIPRTAVLAYCLITWDRGALPYVGDTTVGTLSRLTDQRRVTAGSCVSLEFGENGPFRIPALARSLVCPS